MLTNWENFAQKYAIHPKYGVIVPPEYFPASFDFGTLLSANKRIQHITQICALEEFIQSFPALKLQPPHSFNDLIILHDFTNTVVNTYLAKKRQLNMSEEGTRLSKNLAEPLYISSKALGIHYGMQVNMLYNWLPLNDNHLKEDEGFGLADVALRHYLTQEQYQEKLFFGSTAIASFYLARIIKNIFEMNKIIEERPNQCDEIVERLKNCLRYWEKIKQENLIVVQQFQTDYFNHFLRPLVRGFKNIVLEGVENGQDLVVSAPGGSAGYDPTFQMFQAAFGIKSENKYHEMQMMMRKGMPNKHLDCILFLEQNSHIRDYCAMAGTKTRELFNKVIMAYGSFLRVHSEFIAKFIVGHAKQKQTDQKAHMGTAGTVIHEIILRYQSVESQTIPEPVLPKCVSLSMTSISTEVPEDIIISDDGLNNFD